MAVLDFLHLGSSLALRSFGRIGSSVSLGGVLQLAGADTYVRYNSGVEITVGSNRGLTVTSSGGSLHGAWSADSTISTSDRRLKEAIAPIEDVLGLHAPKGEDPALWTLRELRPVSFRLKRSSESKTRLGFMADELEAVLPELIRDLPSDPRRSDVPDPKGVVYQDLIALLAAAFKAQLARLEALEARFNVQEEEMRNQAIRQQELEERLARAENAIRQQDVAWLDLPIA